MTIMSLRSRSHVKASMILTRADHLFIHNYIVYKIISKYYFKTYCNGPDVVGRGSNPYHIGCPICIYIYIYIYIYIL